MALEVKKVNKDIKVSKEVQELMVNKVSKEVQV
jgi:hypothetical protein